MFTIIRRIGAITRLIQIDSNKHFKPLALNNNLFIYLIRVVENPGMFLGELADNMQIDRTTSFRTIKKLEKQGYLTLENDAENRKIKRVWPTENAKQLYPELHAYEAETSDKLLSKLSESERDQLEKLLDKLEIE